MNQKINTQQDAHLSLYFFSSVFVCPAGEPTARSPASLTAVAGEALDLHCPVAGYPLHSYVWMRGQEYCVVLRISSVC